MVGSILPICRAGRPHGDNDCVSQRTSSFDLNPSSFARQPWSMAREGPDSVPRHAPRLDPRTYRHTHPELSFHTPRKPECALRVRGVRSHRVSS